MWITNGTQDENKTPADCVLLYAQSNKKVSTFVIERGFEGYEVGQKNQRQNRYACFQHS